MRNITRRLNTIEKQLSLGQHEKQVCFLPLIISCKPTNSTGKDIDKLGPVETWTTYQEQLEAQQKAHTELLKENSNNFGAVIIIDLDVDEEYQAREQLKGQGNA